MKREDEDKKSQPVIKDSTLGGDNYGLQGLANRIAAKRSQPPQPQPPIHMADGGQVPSPDMWQQFKAALGQVTSPITKPMGIVNNGVQGAASAAMPMAPTAVAALGQLFGQAPDLTVDADALPDTPAPAPQPTAPPAPAPKAAAPATPPPLSDMATTLNQTPNTNYDFYKDLSADDRLALQKKLMAQQNSPRQMVAQGFAGLGDAISNSYGGKNTSFQKDVMANNELQQKKQLEAVDTARGQKSQDMQMTMEATGNDPNSPLSQSMRKTFNAAGLKVPSGMSANMLMKISPALGELAMKQATLGMQKMQIDATIGNQTAVRRTQAAKELQDRSLGRKVYEGVFGPSDETKVLQDELHGDTSNAKHTAQSSMPHGIPDLGSTFNGQKVTKVTQVK